MMTYSGSRISERIRYGDSGNYSVYAYGLSHRDQVAHENYREACALEFFYHR